MTPVLIDIKLNTRKLNEYRPTSKNNVCRLIIRNTCAVEVESIQIPHLKKTIWVKQDGQVVALVNDKLIAIQDYIVSVCKKPLPNLTLANKVTDSNKTTTTKSNKGLSFDKSGNRYIVSIGSSRKYYSEYKYGSLEKARVAAISYLDFKKTTRK